MDMLKEVKEWATLVGDMQLKKLGDQHEISTKSCANDLVTEVDRLSEQMIIDLIRNSYPDDCIISEESGVLGGQSEYTWVVDPLDGTTNYSHGFPIFSVSIALTRKSETLLGVIYAPALGELFYALKGEGAYRNGKPISVSGCDCLAKALLATGFPYEHQGRVHNLDRFDRLFLGTQAVRVPGSAAWEFCCVACGRLDAYWEFSLSPWDAAAGELIVTEAGGTVVNMSTPDTKLALLAGNETMCQLVLKELARE
jgi:myo-inositol-1(or 4)-monophosphatase